MTDVDLSPSSTSALYASSVTSVTHVLFYSLYVDHVKNNQTNFPRVGPIKVYLILSIYLYEKQETNQIKLYTTKEKTVQNEAN